MAGADLKYIAGILAVPVSADQAVAFSQKPSRRCIAGSKGAASPSSRRSNGPALGGGYELALACHRRIIVDDPKALVGLPEVTVGLPPDPVGRNACRA